MDESGIDQIARELSQLLEEQLKAIAGRGLEDLTNEELAAYEKRRARIATLRTELVKLSRPT